MRKRIISLAIALVLCVSLTVPALAEGQTVTVENGFSISNVVEQKTAPVTDFDEWTKFEGDIKWASEYLLYFPTVEVYYCDAPATITVTTAAYVEIISWFFNNAEISGSSIINDIQKDDEGYNFGELTFTEPGTYYVNDGYTASFGRFFIVIGDNSTATPAPEAPSSWAAEQVNAAIDAGLVPENLQKNYAQPVSRGDVAQMFINLIEQSSGQTIDAFLAAKGVEINTGAFTDTSDKAVLAANALGIINGIGDNKFGPDGTFTRAQVAAIINRVARALDVETEGYAHTFTDVDGHWVGVELGWPVHAGIINGVGDNKFNPEGQLTTEQAIAITYRALQSLKK